MSDSAGASGAAEDFARSQSHALVLEAIDAGRRGVREEEAARIKEIEAWREAELAKLERARAALTGDEGEAERDGSQRPAPERRKLKRRRSRRASTSAASVTKRREDVSRLIGEGAEPIASGEIGRMLDMSSPAVHTALRQLLKERRIVRVGVHAATKYTLRRGLDGARGRPSGEPASRLGGTLQGGVVETIEDRSSATAEELAQALRVPLNQIVDVCGALQAEDEIQMSSRNGKPVYVIQARV